MGQRGAAVRAALQFGLANTQQEPSPSLSASCVGDIHLCGGNRMTGRWKLSACSRISAAGTHNFSCAILYASMGFSLDMFVFNITICITFETRANVTPFLKNTAWKCHCKTHMCYFPLTVNDFSDCLLHPSTLMESQVKFGSLQNISLCSAVVIII